jgi:hypothetical protein
MASIVRQLTAPDKPEDGIDIPELARVAKRHISDAATR